MVAITAAIANTEYTRLDPELDCLGSTVSSAGFSEDSIGASPSSFAVNRILVALTPPEQVGVVVVPTDGQADEINWTPNVSEAWLKTRHLDPKLTVVLS